jgi:hypothetical protein
VQGIEVGLEPPDAEVVRAVDDVRNRKLGTNVMILKNICAEKFGEKNGVFYSKYCWFLLQII